MTNTIAISVGGATKLVFYLQPLLGVAGVAFPAQPIVGTALRAAITLAIAGKAFGPAASSASYAASSLD